MRIWMDVIVTATDEHSRYWPLLSVWTLIAAAVQTMHLGILGLSDWFGVTQLRLQQELTYSDLSHATQRGDCYQDIDTRVLTDWLTSLPPKQLQTTCGVKHQAVLGLCWWDFSAYYLSRSTPCWSQFSLTGRHCCTLQQGAEAATAAPQSAELTVEVFLSWAPTVASLTCHVHKLHFHNLTYLEMYTDLICI